MCQCVMISVSSFHEKYSTLLNPAGWYQNTASPTITPQGYTRWVSMLRFSMQKSVHFEDQRDFHRRTEFQDSHNSMSGIDIDKSKDPYVYKRIGVLLNVTQSQLIPEEFFLYPHLTWPFRKLSRGTQEFMDILSETSSLKWPNIKNDGFKGLKQFKMNGWPKTMGSKG